MTPDGPPHRVAAKSRLVSLCLLGPADEVPGVGAVGGLRAGQPCLQVALPGGGQGQVAGGEPVEQGDGGLDVPLGGRRPGCGWRARRRSRRTQPAHDVPDGVAVQQLLLAGVGAAGDDAGDPAFQPGHLLIAWRQGPGGDQDAAQVLDRLAGGQLVEGAVGERSSRPARAGSPGRRSCSARPATVAGRSAAGEGMVEGLQVGADLAGLVAEQLAQPLLEAAAGAPAGVDAAGLPAAGAAAPEPGVGAGAGRAERLVAGAAADRAAWPQPRAAGPALLAGPAPRLAGGLGDHARARARRRSRRSASCTGRQCRHSGPSGVRTLTGRRRPQPTQVSWLAGSVIRQFGHSGRPCSSRVAASRTAPHRAQGWARDLATQLRHEPLPVDPPVQADDPAAAGAGRPDDPGRRRRRARRSAAAPTATRRLRRPRRSAGSGWSSQGPGQPAALPGPGSTPRVTAATRAQPAAPDRCAATTSVTISAGSWPSPGGHCAHRGRPSRSREADPAGPAAGRAAARAGPQTPQYQSWPRRCRVRRSLPHSAQTGGEIARRARLAQRDQQVPDGPGCRRAPVGQHRRPVEQGLGQPAPLGPAAGDAASPWPR